MNKILAVILASVLALLSTVAGAVTVSSGDVVDYDSNDPPELVGDLGPYIYWIGTTFVDPLDAYNITINAPSGLPGTLDYVVSNGPNATGTPYATGSLVAGGSVTLIMGGIPQASLNNPVTEYFAMAAYGLSTPIPIDNGVVGSVPIPPAVWLFGSGLLGLVGISRRKSSSA